MVPPSGAEQSPNLMICLAVPSQGRFGSFHCQARRPQLFPVLGPLLLGAEKNPSGEQRGQPDGVGRCLSHQGRSGGVRLDRGLSRQLATTSAFCQSTIGNGSPTGELSGRVGSCQPAQLHNHYLVRPQLPPAGAVSLCLNFRPRMLNGPAAATSSIGVIAGTFPSGNG